MRATDRNRRRLLRGAAAAVTALGGCLGLDGGDQTATEASDVTTSGDDPTTTETGDPTTTETGDPTTTETGDVAATDGASTGSSATTDGDANATTTASEDLDPREANVVDVSFERTDDGYRFDVTLSHDDDAEEGYADWWQIETLSGETLGRRKFSHAHGSDPFTRSETVSVPEDVECVVVRGHDQTHEYGGRAVILHLPTGKRRVVRQGSKQESFVDYEC